jgi:hypothetical protein
MDPATYPARLCQLIDLGLQPRSYKGEKKDPAREIMLTYEFVDEFLKDEDGNDDPDKPRWLSESMPLFNLEADRAKSTARYLALDPTQEHEGDFVKLLGVPCLVTIVHNKGKGDRVFENIAGVAPMREKDAKKCPELVNEPRVFDLEEPDMEVFLGLPKWVRDKIVSNLEFEGSELSKLLKDGDEGPGKEKAEKAKGEDENPY